MRTHSLLIVCLVAAGTLSITAEPPAMCAKKAATTKAASQSPEAAVRARISDLKSAVTTNNAKAASGLWTENGRYVDEDGNLYVGRAALEKMFSSVFGQYGKPQVEIVVDQIRFPAPSVALVDGTVKRMMAPNTPAVPANHYSLVLEQKDGAWWIGSAIETPITATATTSSALSKLDWLVGEWEAKRDGGEVRMKAEWAPSKNFIYCTYRITRAGSPELKETQIIGWDPRWQQPISWHFDSSGGFGSGHWISSGNQWMVTSEATNPMGTNLSSLNVISKDGSDAFTWQAVNRRVNGTLVEDTQPLKVERVTKTSSKKEGSNQ